MLNCQSVKRRTETHDDVQLSAQSHFTNDLGLDSLDTVEVVMAIEEVKQPEAR